MDMTEKFDAALKKYRTHNEAAKAAGVSRRTYLAWRNGEMSPAVQRRATIILDSILASSPNEMTYQAVKGDP